MPYVNFTTKNNSQSNRKRKEKKNRKTENVCKMCLTDGNLYTSLSNINAILLLHFILIYFLKSIILVSFFLKMFLKN